MQSWIITVRANSFEQTLTSLTKMGATNINPLQNLSMYVFEFDGSKEDIIKNISDLETVEMDRQCSKLIHP
jgi:hypothetical protein